MESASAKRAVLSTATRDDPLPILDSINNAVSPRTTAGTRRQTWLRLVGMSITTGVPLGGALPCSVAIGAIETRAQIGSCSLRAIGGRVSGMGTTDVTTPTAVRSEAATDR
jgi:hypothetical protein